MKINGASFLLRNKILIQNIGSGAKVKRIGNCRSFRYTIAARSETTETQKRFW